MKARRGKGTRMKTVKWTSGPACSAPCSGNCRGGGTYPIGSGDIEEGLDDGRDMMEQAGTMGNTHCPS